MRALTPLLAAVLMAATPAAGSSKDEAAKMEPAAIVAQSDVNIGLSGLVCDFCSIALNKTFRKREEVRATHVDLDTKVLSVVMVEGATLDDATLETLVETAGYNVTGIERVADASPRKD